MIMDVLVLDLTWQPSHVINLRKALDLLLTGRAVPVCEEVVGVMRSPSTEVPIPAVIRVSSFVRMAFTGSGSAVWSRKRILVRDDYECQFVVGGNPCSTKATTIDHLQPQSRGGEDSWENTVAACQRHNGMKSNRTLDEMSFKYGWKLRREPVSIRLLLAADKSFERVKEMHPAWVYFLGEQAKA